MRTIDSTGDSDVVLRHLRRRFHHSDNRARDSSLSAERAADVDSRRCSRPARDRHTHGHIPYETARSAGGLTNFAPEISQKRGGGVLLPRFCLSSPTHHKLFVANDIPHPQLAARMSPSKKLLTLITPPCYSAASLLTKPASNHLPGSHHL